MNTASYIDHTLLKADCSITDIKNLCQEAIQYQFASVCVPPYYVKDAASLLKDKKVKVSTVVGFPMGYSSTPIKIEEIKRALDEGADEIDAVINIGAIKSQNWSYVKNEMDSMSTTVQWKNKEIKIILETGLLHEEEIEQLAEMALEIKPNFLKTSTGFNGPGAEIAKVLFLQKLLQNKIKIKASGGIRTYADAETFIKVGASRIGTSSGIAILKGS